LRIAGARWAGRPVASFAIREGIDPFTLSRLMGTSLQMIDHHYGHLLQGADDAALRFLTPENGLETDSAEEAR
jgi:hypothetical protein